MPLRRKKKYEHLHNIGNIDNIDMTAVETLNGKVPGAAVAFNVTASY
jgi:hypothetical protein